MIKRIIKLCNNKKVITYYLYEEVSPDRWKFEALTQDKQEAESWQKLYNIEEIENETK